MTLDSEHGPVSDSSLLERALGPELYEPVHGRLSSHQAIRGMLRGEGLSRSDETVLEQESHRLEEVLRRVFDNLEQSLMLCTSVPELSAMHAAIDRVRHFPHPQLNRDSLDFPYILENAISQELGEDTLTLLRNLLPSEMKEGAVSPQIQQAWEELVAVWEKLRQRAPELGVTGIKKLMVKFEVEQMNEVRTLIEDRAKAMSLIEKAQHNLAREARRFVEEIAESQVLEWELLEELLYKRYSGEWRQDAESGIPRIEQLVPGTGLEQLLSQYVQKRGETRLEPQQILNDFLHSLIDFQTSVQLPSDLLNAFMEFSLEQLSPQSSNNEASEEDNAAQAKLDVLAQKHLMPGEYYTLSDGTRWYWGEIGRQKVILPEEEWVKIKGESSNPTMGYFFREALERVASERVTPALQERVQESAEREAWNYVLQQSQVRSSQELISWLDQKTEWVKELIQSGNLAPEMVASVADREVEDWWHVETEPLQFQSIFKGERSALQPSEQMLARMREVLNISDVDQRQLNIDATRYFRLVRLLKELWRVDLAHVQERLIGVTGAEMLTQEVLDKIEAVINGLAFPVGVVKVAEQQRSQ